MSTHNGLLLERPEGRRNRDRKAFVQVPIDASLFKPIMWVSLIVIVLVVAMAVTQHFGAFYSQLIQDELSHIQNEAKGSYKELDAQRDMRRIRVQFESEMDKLRLTVLAQDKRIKALENSLDAVLGINGDNYVEDKR
jgi:uncharacterized protein HemX